MLADRKRASTGNPFERSVGFSRAIRIGNTIYTAGTLSNDASGQIHGSDAYEQCCYILEKLSKVLAELGSSLDHVVRTTSYLTALEHAEGYTRAHQQYFGATLPVATCVVVASFFGKDAVVEMELIAIVPQDGPG